MTEKRMGEIALLIFKQRLREDGVRLKKNFRREAGSEAQKLGIEAEELVKFAEIIIRKLVDEAFAPEA